MFETPLDVLLFIIATGFMMVGLLTIYDERREILDGIWNIFKHLIYLLYKFIELWK